MRSLSALLSGAGWTLAAIAVIAAIAESEAGFLGFGSLAAVALAVSWWASRRGSAIVGPGEAQVTGETRECGYCTSEIPASALRCPKCSGEFHHCPHCKQLVAVRTRQKTVGLARGGRTPVADCLRCGKQLTGPRW